MTTKKDEELLDLDESAEFLGYSRKWLQRMKRQGTVQARKIKGKVLFEKRDLEKLREEKKASQQKIERKKRIFLNSMASGLSRKEAADKVGIDNSNLRWYFMDEDFLAEYRQVHAEKKKEVLEAFQSGCTLMQAADQAGVSRSAVRGWRKNDLEFNERYNKIADRKKVVILEALKNGQSKTEAARQAGITYNTLASWLRHDAELAGRFRNSLDIKKRNRP